jgi:hypothetical protein
MTNKIHSDEPLDLAVYSLPKPQDSVQAMPPMTGRWKLLAIMFICSLPVIASYLAYFVVRPQGRAGFGELIDPIRPVSTMTGKGLDGVERPLAALKGQWLLVSVGNGACDKECQQRLFLQRQLRETLGKDKDRLDWVWLINDDTPVAESMRKPLGDAVVLRMDQTTLNNWLIAPPGKSLADFLYVVDPLGNTMMRFPANFDGSGATKARRDLEKLLRASLSWDPPGR